MPGGGRNGALGARGPGGRRAVSRVAEE